MRGRLHIASLCQDLVLFDAAPEWIELLPQGPAIEGFDGRRWLLEDPRVLVDAFTAKGLQLPIDVEHATQLKAPKGEPAPAVGWITELKVHNGGLIGRVDWTPKGVELTRTDKAYKYISPAFLHDLDGNIVQLLSAGLTNTPNLDLAALNRQDGAQETSMHKAICKQLGIPETSTEAEVAAALTKVLGERDQAKADLVVARNAAQQPSLDKFVPRQDYDVALNRATTAEQKLREFTSAALEKDIDAALEGASKAGKITPATVEYHRAQCRQEGGLERFKKFVEAAPVIGGASGLDGKRPEQQGAGGKLSELEQAVCRNLGLSEDKFIAARG